MSHNADLTALTYVDPTYIKVREDRQRQVFDADELTKLKQSILTFGQLHPIIVNSNMELISGERRLRCCVELKRPVYFKIQETTSPSFEKKLELEENFCRVNLEWWETCEAFLALHQTLAKDHYEKHPDASAWKQSDTANVLRVSRPLVSQYIAIALAFQVHPELRKLGSYTEAYVALKKFKEQEALARLAAMHKEKIVVHRDNAVVEPQPDRVDYSNKLFQIDCLEYLKGIADETFDVIYTDPMWGVNIDSQITRAQVIADDSEKCRALLSAFIKEAYRVLKPDRWMIIWFGIEVYEWLKAELIAAGFSLDIIPVVWSKSNGIANDLHYSLGRSYEVCLWARKGTPVIYQERTRNVFDVRAVSKKRHPFEKPIDLAKLMLQCITITGMKFFDGFMGSGTSCVAAQQLELDVTGCEIDKDFYNIAIETWENNVNNRE